MKTGEFYFYLVKDLDQYLSCYSAYGISISVYDLLIDSTI